MSHYSFNPSYIPLFPSALSSKTDISNFADDSYRFPPPSPSSQLHSPTSSSSFPFLLPPPPLLLPSSSSFLPPPLIPPPPPPTRLLAPSAIFSTGPGYNSQDLEELYIILFDKLSDLKKTNTELELSLREIEKNVDKKKNITKILSENELWSQMISEKSQEIKELTLTQTLEEKLQRLAKENFGLEERARKLRFGRIFPKFKIYYDYEEAMRRRMREEEEEGRKREEELRMEEKRRKKENEVIVCLVREKGRMVLDVINIIYG